MKLYLERSNWWATQVFGIGVSWEDRCIGEYRIWVDAGWIALTIFFKLKEVDNETTKG